MNNGHILIVDDDTGINRMFQLLLKDAGYRVSSTFNGEETLKFLKVIVPDVILLDISLPDIGGVELARTIKNNPAIPFVPIIHVTASGDMRTKVTALDSGADDILIKPVEFAELLARVRVMVRLQQGRRELESSTRRIQLLFNLSQTLTTSLDINHVLQEIVGQLATGLEVIRASIMLVDQQSLLSFYASSTNSTLDPNNLTKILRDGLAGWVIRAQRPLIINDARRDQRWNVLGRANDAVRSVIAVPLLNQNRAVGVITAVHTRINYFNESHLELIQAVATQCVVAFDHALLFQLTSQQKQQLERRSTILTEMLTIGEQMRLNLPLSEMLNRIASAIQRSLDLEQVIIHIQHGDEITQGLAGSQLKTMQTQWSPEYIHNHVSAQMTEQSRVSRSYRLNRERMPLVHADAHSEFLAVPIGSMRQRDGIIVVEMLPTDSPSEMMRIQALEVFANQVASMVQNNQLFTLEQKRANQLQLLVDIGHNLAQLMTPDQLIRLVISLVRHTFHFTTVHVVCLGADGTVEKVANQQGSAPHTLLANQQLLQQIKRDPQVHTTYQQNFALNYVDYDPAIHAELIVPLIDRMGVRGFLIAANSQETPFEPLTTSLLNAVAAQLVIGLDNAALFVQEQAYVQQMARINQLSIDLTAQTDVVAQLPALLPAINTIFASPASAIILNTKQTQIFTAPNQDPKPQVVDFAELIASMDEKSVIQLNGSQSANPLQTLARNLGMSNALVQILSMDNGHGLLMIDAPNPHYVWRSHDQAMVQTVANLLAQAIENSHLQQQRMERLRTDMSRYMTSSLVEQLLSEGGINTVTERDVVVLFADLRGFTALSEHLAPRVIVEQVLNRFFDTMTNVLYEHNAVIDKFLGDGMMVVFGSVRSQADDVESSVQAASAMHRAFQALQARWLADFGRTVGLGIGLSWGRAVVGNIGSAQRLDYTVIGDVVNTASRLMSIAQSGQIIISQQLADHLPATLHDQLEALPPVKLKGKSEAIAIYSFNRE